MGATRARALLIAVRQQELAALLEQAGFQVEVRTRPLQEAGELVPRPDVAIVFRGRLIGRNQALLLSEQGVPVIELLTVEPPGRSKAGWLRLSNRIAKSDLVQIAETFADQTAVRRG